MEKLSRQLSFFTFILISIQLSGQTEQKDFRQAEKLTDGQEVYYKWASFSHFNDLFSLFGISDRYYSFGHQIDYMKRIKVRPEGKDTKDLFYNISLNFEGYTPDHEIDFPDTLITRPYAAWSYLTFSFINNKPNRYLKYGLDIGFIGPKAKGKEIQNWVHKHISDDPEVLGWEDQIDNQIGINLSLDWRETLYLSGKHRIMAGSQQKVGNIFTYLWPTVRYQFNWAQDGGYLPFQYAHSSSSNITLEASLGFKYEFYNLSIEGKPSNNVFQPLDEEVINRALFTAGIGVRYHYRKFSMHFSNQFNSMRIKGNDNHIYGVLGLSYSWN